jgi:hypothetical protein
MSATERKEVEAYARKELERLRSASGPTLARVGLPGGEEITIVAIRCGTTKTSCHRLAEEWEPARSAYLRHSQKRRAAKRISASGPLLSDASSGERTTVLDMVVTHDCAGVRPSAQAYALAFGILRGMKDIVTDQAGGRTVRMKTATIPARMRPEGVLVYGLLLPGPNDVVVQEPGGHVVSQERWAGSNEEVSCDSK